MAKKLTTGEKGWIGLVAYIVAIDSIAWWLSAKHQRPDETMSVAWGRWLQKPGSRVAVGSAWAIVTGHLFLSVPLPGGRTLKNAVQRRAVRSG